MDETDESAFTREDLKWFKPTQVREKEEYGSPADLTSWVLSVFIILMLLKMLLMLKNCLLLKRAEKKWNKRQEEIEMELADQRLAQKEWEEGIMNNEQGLEEQEKGLSESGYGNVTKTKRGSLSQYSDVDIQEGEIDDLLKQ